MRSDAMNTRHIAIRKLAALTAGCLLALSSITSVAEPVVIEVDLPQAGVAEQALGYIVQADSVKAATDAVEAVGGEVTHELGTIDAVGAALLPAQVELLKRRSNIRLMYSDRMASSS